MTARRDKIASRFSLSLLSTVLVFALIGTCRAELANLTAAKKKKKPAVALQSVASGFQGPVDLQMPDDGTGRFFVVEQAGTIKIIQGGSVLA